MNWIVPRMWEGGTCIILGGGPSLLKQFDVPVEVIQGVYSGKLKPSAYSPYLEAIHKSHVIAVNVAYRIGSWIDMMFFGDTSTWDEEKDGILQFNGLRVTCADNITPTPYLKFLGKDPKRKVGLSPDRSLVGWNRNSGAAAINVAVHTGAKRIILFGFDMKLDNEMNQHWHKIYSSPLDITTSIFNKHLIGFPQIKRDADALGVEIINCNPNSGIECFPKCNFKDLKL